MLFSSLSLQWQWWVYRQILQYLIPLQFFPTTFGFIFIPIPTTKEVTWSLQWNNWLDNIGGKIILWYQVISLAKLDFIHYSVVYSKREHGPSLVLQWLRLCAPNAGGAGSIPSLGIPHASWRGPKYNNKTERIFFFLLEQHNKRLHIVSSIFY